MSIATEFDFYVTALFITQPFSDLVPSYSNLRHTCCDMHANTVTRGESNLIGSMNVESAGSDIVL